MFISAGMITEAEAAQMIELLEDPHTVLTSASLISAWGRRPGRGPDVGGAGFEPATTGL